MGKDTETQIRDNISRAKTDLRMHLPFVGHILYQTPVHILPDDTKEIAYTDGLNIYINSAYAKSLSRAELNFLLAHEAGHIIFKTMLRRGARDHHLWNVATDYVINSILIEAGIQKDRLAIITKSITGEEFHPCYDKKYTGWAAEAVYEDILKQMKQRASQSQIAQQNSGAGNSGEGENSKSTAQAEGKKTGKGKEKQSDANESRDGWGQSVNGHRSFDPKTGTTTPQKSDGTQTTWGEVETHINTVIAQAACRAQEDLRRSDSCGKGAGAFLEYVDVALSKQVNWRKLLHKSLRVLGFENADYSRPSRRTIINRMFGCKYYYPKLRGSTPGNIMMVIDTSGSVSSDSLEVFLGEINNCLRGMPKTEVYLYCADTDIVYQGTYRGKLPTKVDITGRGGTSFNEAFEEAAKLRKQGKNFSTMVYFTDGYCDYPNIKAKTLPYEVLWCMDNMAVEDAPFGKTLRIDPNI